MASQYFAILTDYGTRAIAHALSQRQPLQITQFAVGDGNGQAVTPTASATALVHQTHIAPVSAVSLDPRNNKQVIVELTIPENVGGFYIREMGVFDSQNKLIAYANCPESFKPTESSGSGKVQVLRMILKVESSSAVTLSIDNSVIFVTRQQMTPKTITATTQNGFDESGHSHEINKASTSQQGIVQLTNDTGLESESLALTAKAGKKLAQLIATVQLALNNYIPLNKRSSAVNSNDENNVATSKAVKTAYDKGVEAKNAADNAQRTANDGVSKADAAQLTANDGVSKANAANNNANDRVSKSGDTMTGTLTIENNEPRVHGKKAGTHKWFIGLPNANTDYPRFHSYANDTWMELNSGNIIVNKPLYLGNNPLPSSLNGHHVQFRWNNTALELKVDNSELGYLHTSIKAYVETNVVDNNYSGLNIIRKGTSGNFWARFEALPDRRWKFSTENGSTIHLKNQSGNILLDSDTSHSTNGTNKAKVASEFAVGELARSFSYQKIGNFEVRKYPDGTMIQTYFVDFYDVHGPNSGIGGTGQKQLTWAVSFVGKPLVWGNITSSLEDSHDVGVNILTKSTGTTLYWYNYEHSNQNQGACRLQFLAIGRWK